MSRKERRGRHRTPRVAVAAVAELDRAFDELELDGVMLLSNFGGTYLGDPAMEPLFAALGARGAYVFVQERHGQIRLQLSHLGGAAPFLAHRLASLADREPDQAQRAPAGALAYLARLGHPLAGQRRTVDIALTSASTSASERGATMKMGYFLCCEDSGPAELIEQARVA